MDACSKPFMQRTFSEAWGCVQTDAYNSVQSVFNAPGSATIGEWVTTGLVGVIALYLGIIVLGIFAAAAK